MQLVKRIVSAWGAANKVNGPRSPAGERRKLVDLLGASETIAAATALAAEGQYGRSLAQIDAVLAFKPGSKELLFARASTLFSWGRYRESRDALLALEKLGLDGGAFYMKLGWASFWSGDLGEAERWMRKAADTQPDDWAAQFAIGTALHAQRKSEDARAHFQRALEMNPGDPYCIGNLVACELALNRPEVAEPLARHAVEIDPNNAVGWSNLGATLDHQERYSEALAAFAKAEELSAASGELQYDYVNFAICLLRDAQTRNGIAFLESKLPQYPSVMAHSHYSLSLLLSGRMEEGWEHYEFRWVDGPLKATRANFSRPAWDGQDLRGKTILVRSEQGFGDFIQFIRYVPHVKALGAKVLLQLPEAVRKLADGVAGVDHVLLPDEPYPPFDFFVNLLSLPRIFGTRIATIPAQVPYLHANAELAEEWKARLGNDDSVKIGLAWAGSPTHLRDKFRSLSLEALAALRELRGVQFFSLQKGPATAQLRDSPEGLNIVDLELELNDFVDTAAAISQLDLVLCVDTSVAHLAGALGKPVWLMLPKPCDWRWLEDRDDSPWYPTMRLFRQTSVGEWSDVVARVVASMRGIRRDELGGIWRKSNSGEPHAGPDLPLVPRAEPGHRNGSMSAAAYTAVGTLQYWPDQYPVGPSIRYYGEYLQPQLELLARMVQPGSTVMEVGSGVGAHAAFLGKAIGPIGHLIIYEPRPPMQGVLRQNLSSNGIANVTIMKNAIGAPQPACTEADKTSGRSKSGESSSWLQTSIETIDELQLERLHWLKINEHDRPLDVLRGAVSTLWRLRPMLFVAAMDENHLHEFAAMARECSYRAWQVKSPLFNPANFNRRDRDLFSGAIALALLAIPEEVEMDIALDGCIELL